MALAAAALTADDAPSASTAGSVPSSTAAKQHPAAKRQPVGGKAAQATAAGGKATTHDVQAAAAAADARRRRSAGFKAHVRRLLAAAAARVTPPLAAECLQLQVRLQVGACCAMCAPHVHKLLGDAQSLYLIVFTLPTQHLIDHQHIMYCVLRRMRCSARRWAGAAAAMGRWSL